MMDRTEIEQEFVQLRNELLLLNQILQSILGPIVEDNDTIGRAAAARYLAKLAFQEGKLEEQT